MDHSNKETSKSKLKIGKIKTRHKFNTARQMHSLFYILKTTAVENIVQFNRLAINQKALVSCNFFFTRMVRKRILPAHVDRPCPASTCTTGDPLYTYISYTENPLQSQTHRSNEPIHQNS